MAGGLEAYLKPGYVVLDIGANRGTLTKAYADAVGRTGTVIACEPLPESAANLRARCAAWPQVQVREVAVSSSMGTDTLVQDRDHMLCSLWAANVRSVAQVHTVETVTLDSLTAHLPLVHGIKIDAQGADMAILSGGAHALRRPETTWMIEVWPKGLTGAGSSVAALVECLRSAGLVIIGEGKAPLCRSCAWENILGLTSVYTNIVCRKQAC